MNPKSAASKFLVPSNSDPTSYTPLSDVTDTSGSSYDDGPAEDGSNREFPVTEQRLYVINRAGTGEASYLLLTKDAKRILSYSTPGWRWTKGNTTNMSQLDDSNAKQISLKSNLTARRSLPATAAADSASPGSAYTATADGAPQLPRQAQTS